MPKYENVINTKKGLFVSEYHNGEIIRKYVKYIPKLYIPTNKKTPFKSIRTKQYLEEKNYKTLQDYNNALKMYQSSGINVHGNRSLEQGYIRETYGEPTLNDHPFHTLYLDIEVAQLDKSIPPEISKNDWKPQGLRAAMANILSIQMLSNVKNKFIIFGLNKNWVKPTTKPGLFDNVRYIKFDDEADMLKAFIATIKTIKPTIICGFNSEQYDIPYITMRVLRVLDKKDNLFIKQTDRKGVEKLVFNKGLLDSPYVKQLSPAEEVTYQLKNTNFGEVHTFKWLGYIFEDYKNLHDKYTYTTLTSNSLSAIATHELGDDKVNHDEFTNFLSFYEGDYTKYERDYSKKEPSELDLLYDEIIKNPSNKEELIQEFKIKSYDLFIRYGIGDVKLLDDLDNKLKLIDLAKYLSYYCGVTMDDIRGTVKQWNSFMFNEALLKHGLVLPIKNTFPETDMVLPKYVLSDKYQGKNKKEYQKIFSNPDNFGQKFVGGWTRGTAKFWKWVFSLDFTSLYPSVQMWANIGIDTLIEPKDLPEELLELRAKYFIYYPKDVDASEIEQYDYRFIREVLFNKEVRDEIHRVLKKYNVSATPNGMFFRKDERSVMSLIIERLIKERKEYKKLMKRTEQEIEDIKKEIAELEKVQNG